jgi:hypothetical protein
MTSNHWVVGSIPTRCMPQYQRLTMYLVRSLEGWLGHFSATFLGSVSAKAANRRLSPVFGHCHIMNSSSNIDPGSIRVGNRELGS